MAHDIETPILIVGAGPAGIIAALSLAKLGIACTLMERNLETTRYPKMNITNCRTMEMFKRLGIDQKLRQIGVASQYPFDSLFSSGLSEGGEIITKWSMPSPDEWREQIKRLNDGSQPREPYQRCSQAIFEKAFKPLIQKEPLVTSHFGHKFESLQEKDDCVVSRFSVEGSPNEIIIKSQYVIGCDGAGSRVRRSIGGSLVGGPISAAFYLVHFKSTDLARLQKYGQYWHIFFTSGAAVIAQNQVDTWTVHKPIGLDVDHSQLDPHETIAEVLGGSTGTPYPIKVDEILATSSWRPNICIADRYRSAGGRVFLSGDSAHQNIPTGGYGYNTAVGDSVDIAWKLAAVLTGWGGNYLLDSYEIERRPVAVRNIECSGLHRQTHATYVEWVKQADPQTLFEKTEEGQKLRQRIRDHLQQNDGENKFFGIEMGYRYNHSPIVVSDNEVNEPDWTAEDYIPSTWPGARPPHVFLADNETSIFDLFGPGFSLVDFTQNKKFIHAFEREAKSQNIAVRMIHLPDEKHARNLWERDAVLVRPDDMVAWRANVDGSVPTDTAAILRISVGRDTSMELGKAEAFQQEQTAFVTKSGFTATIGNVVNQDNIEKMSAWQVAV
ncbi:FAD binding domain-containing protein [Cladophialophora immunda]|nr:FAD binding domain-containing protein [Cladophialophora immunda]